MRSVFLKEWRQGRLIVIFGLVLAGLIPALWAVLSTVYVRDFRNQQNVDLFCGILYYIVPLFLAVVVGSGIFAAELERGTLPLLLALPFSRRAVWLGKLLAGLALTFSAIVLIFAPAVIARAPVLEEAQFWLLAPDLLLWTIILFCISFFWSTLCASIMGAVLATIILWALLAIAAWFAIGFLGARLLGTSVLLDAELWMLATCPALLTGSYVGFARGELLQSRRRWILPSATALAATLVICLALIGAIRWETRYDRSQIEHISWHASITGGGSAVSLLALAQPVRLKRDAGGWLGPGQLPTHRSQHLVLLHLDTREELLVRRGTGAASLSPDGTRAALLVKPPGITWGSRGRGIRRLEIWDLSQDRLLYRGYLQTTAPPSGPPGAPLPRRSALNAVEWSPDSRWLTVYNMFGDKHEFLVMDPQGRDLRRLATKSLLGGSWGWSRDSAVYYLDAGLRVVRHSPVQNANHLVCDPRDFPEFPKGTAPEAGTLTVSPDGRFLTVSLLVRESRSAREYRSGGDADGDQVVSFVLRADGSQPQLIYRNLLGRSSTISNPGFFWSPDGRHLYFLEPKLRNSVLHWSAQRAVVGRIPLPVSLTRGYIRLLPHSSGLLVWQERRAWTLDDREQLRPLQRDYLRWLDISSIVGFDAAGRAIVPRAEEVGHSLVSLDLATGETTRIYP